MSRANVELAHRYEAALNARKVPDGLLASDFVMVNAETAVTDKSYHGAAGVIEWTKDIFEAFASGARFEIERVVAEGDDFVVAVCRIGGVGARSGVPLLLRWATVFWIRDGKLARVAGYMRRREALEAVGLEE